MPQVTATLLNGFPAELLELIHHPVFKLLANYLGSSENANLFVASTPLPMRDLSSPTKVAAALVDSCERALSSKPEQASALQRICWLEWQFLFLYGCDY